MACKKLSTVSIKHIRPLGVLRWRQFHATPNLRKFSRPSETEIAKARDFCAYLVKYCLGFHPMYSMPQLNPTRTYDVPSYLLRAYIPESSRDAYLAIRAFNVEVARIADTTSTPAIGMMRMQFWRDTVSKSLEGSPPKEPVAILLAHAAESLRKRSGGKARLSQSWLHRIIHARAQCLGNPPYPTLLSLESYAENTYSTMLYLTLSALPQASLTTDHIASHIGKAMGIAAVLRGIPLIAFPPSQSQSTSKGAVLLPLDVMVEANLREEDVFRQGPAAPGLRDAVFAVATRASDHLITARDMISRLRAEGTLGHEFEHQNDREYQYSAQQLNTAAETKLAEMEKAFGVFMPSVPTQWWLDRLQKVDFDIFHASLRTLDWRVPWKTYWAYTRRKL